MPHTARHFRRSIASLAVLAIGATAFSVAHASTVADVYAQARAGNSSNSLKIAEELVATNPTDAKALEARAYVLRGLGRYTEALADYTRMGQLGADKRTSVQGMVTSLRGMGAAQAAETQALQYPEFFSPDELRDIRYEVASENTRLGANDAQAGPSAFERTDKAIAQFESFARQADLDDPAFLPGAAGFDYLVALFNRHRFDQVCASFDKLQAKGVELPDYARHVVAQSYASRKDPVRALALLTPVAERNRQDFEFVQSYFYLLVDNEEHRKAQAWIDDALARTPRHQDSALSSSASINPRHVKLLILAAWSRAFNDQLPQARELFRAALQVAPANESARNGLATVELWAGRPRAAQAYYQQALAQSSDAIEPQRGLLAVAGARGDEQTLHAGLDALQSQYTEDAQLKRMRADQALRTGAWVSVGMSQATSQLAQRDTSPEVSAYVRFKSEMYFDFLRVTAMTKTSRAVPDGTPVRQGQGSLGLEAQFEDVAATLALVRNRQAHVGIAGTVRWNPVDAWYLGAELESVMAEVPARAVSQGLQGRHAAISAEWRPRETTSLAASFSLVKFTDDNVITSNSLKWREMWHQDAHVQAWTALSLYHSQATRQAVPYFSPETYDSQTITWGVSLLGSRQPWKGASRWHHFEVDTGRVVQKSFAAVTAGAIRYRQAWQLAPGVEAELSVERARRVYDGRPELQNSARAELNFAL